ncbi:Rpn family recombination-promoting nuclease/putative transposase [Nostoc sp. UHCC 0302]|uniref:Rpn family recombination-promoting nuclease/putative transposase n=1 Tax=Nostoc sp. UHCC 0302 TaxID=3134896 RepID=UPI00311CAFC9
MAFDNVCKILAEQYPLEFARWLLPVEPQQIKVLKTELSIEPIRADSVTFLQTENRILHIEFQTRTKSAPPIPFRMLDYSVRLKRQYNIFVTQVIIFLQETNDEVAFLEEYVDETTVHRYRVIRMWEQDSALFLNNQALLALAPLTQTSSPQGLLSQVAQRVATISDRDTRQNIAGYTEILAGLRFDKNLIRQLLTEDIMQESVIYQDILQKGNKQGEERVIILLLNRRFNSIDTSLIERVRGLSIEQLENLAQALFDFTDVSDLETWFEQQESN